MAFFASSWLDLWMTHCRMTTLQNRQQARQMTLDENSEDEWDIRIRPKIFRETMCFFSFVVVFNKSLNKQKAIFPLLR